MQTRQHVGLDALERLELASQATDIVLRLAGRLRRLLRLLGERRLEAGTSPLAKGTLVFLLLKINLVDAESEVVDHRRRQRHPEAGWPDSSGRAERVGRGRSRCLLALVRLVGKEVLIRLGQEAGCGLKSVAILSQVRLRAKRQTERRRCSCS